MRKQFFRYIDSLLPRRIARLPYDVALVVLKGFIGLGMHANVWNRNSTRSGAFIMGVSDLDITVVSHGKISFEFLRYALAKLKTLFIFLGETNLYQESHLGMILPRMNAFELKRDPVLKDFYPVNADEDDVAKFVFTQRMLFSDVFTLKEDPKMRQSKWKNHFDLIGYPHQQVIDLEFVITALKKLCHHNERISRALDNWSSAVFEKNFDVYHSDLGEGFKLLAPHCYLWFELRDDSEFLRSLDAFEEKLFKAQFNWEIWGLYSQRFHLNHDQILEHLGRLKKAHAIISTKEEIERLERDIALAFEMC
jgi:hypothetical protein